MPKLEIGMCNKQGFTLVEIMVVLLIIGITLGFALLSFGDFGAKHQVVFAAEQFVNDVKLAQHQAILETSTLGIWVKQSSYQVYRFNAVGRWQLVSARGVFAKHLFPSQAVIQLQSKIVGSHAPQIVINESGDMTPFKLTIALQGKDLEVVTGHHNGAVTTQMASS